MKAPVLKTGESSGSVGSNPTSSSEEFVRRLGTEIYERMQTVEAGEAMERWWRSLSDADDYSWFNEPLTKEELEACDRAIDEPGEPW